MIQKNIVFAQVTFNKRVQVEEKSAETFIAATLYKVAGTCEYGTMRKQLIRQRDHFIVGIED